MLVAHHDHLIGHRGPPPRKIADAKGWLDAFHLGQGQRCVGPFGRVIVISRSGPPSITSNAGPVGRSGLLADLGRFFETGARAKHILEAQDQEHGNSGQLPEAVSWANS